MAFTREHLKKLAAKGKGGLATWAKKQLGRSNSLVKSVAARTVRKRRSASRSSSSMGGQMAKRYRRSRGSSSGGMGSAGDIAIGGLAYGVANTNVPQLANVSPLMKGIAAWYGTKKTSGPAKGVCMAVLGVETYKIGAGMSVGGLIGGAGQVTGGYM